MPLKKGDPRAAEYGRRGRRARLSKTPPAPQADQVSQDRQAYDSKVEGGTPPVTRAEPEVVQAADQVAPPPPTPAPEPSRGHVQDCALVPRPHDAQGGCCWARVA